MSEPGYRTVLGFDFGHIRIGVAVGQELTGTAQPLVTLTAQRQRPDWNAITRLIAEWQPDVLVVGIPYHLDSSPSTVTDAALRFSRQLRGRYRLAVETINEHLSSHEAKNRITVGSRPQSQDKTTVDRVAAAVILETWFHQQKLQFNTQY